MHLALELGKNEEEVMGWPLSKLVRWVAFFKIKNQREKEALEEAKAKVDGKATW